jgi:hypothetical protein
MNLTNVRVEYYSAGCVEYGDGYLDKVNKGLGGSLADYYNHCKGRCTTDYICKWDGDMIGTDFFRQFMKNKLYRTHDVTRINGLDVYKDEVHVNNTVLCNHEPRIFPNTKRYYYYDTDCYEKLRYGGRKQNIAEHCYLHMKMCKEEYEHLGGKGDALIKDVLTKPASRKGSQGYAVGTGFYSKDTRIWDDVGRESIELKPHADMLFEAWWKNTMKFSSPEKIYVCSADSKAPDLNAIAESNFLDLESLEWANSRNWGHVTQTYMYTNHCGWSMGYLHGMMRCYVDGYDFIYKEQDCFAFGDWVDELYRECAESGNKALMGKFRIQQAEQSLTFIKWEYIPKFMSNWLSIKSRDNLYKPERKFHQLRQESNGNIGKLPFGMGRRRPRRGKPIKYDTPTWYIQQLRADEFEGIGEIEIAESMRI